MFGGLICKFCGFNDTANGVTCNHRNADKAVAVNTDGMNHSLACFQRDGIGVDVAVDGGIFSVCGVIQRAGGGSQFHINVLGIETGLVAGLGGSGPQLLQGLLHGRVGDVFQHGDGIHQFVLLYKGFAQCGIKLHGAVVFNGVGQSNLGFRKITISFILV